MMIIMCTDLLRSHFLKITQNACERGRSYRISRIQSCGRLTQSEDLSQGEEQWDVGMLNGPLG